MTPTGLARAIQPTRPTPAPPRIKPKEPLTERPRGQLVSLRALLHESGKTSINIDSGRFLQADGQKYYRHWHFPGTQRKPSTAEKPKAGQEVLIPITLGPHETSFITEADASYIREQEAIKAQAYLSLNEINARINSEEKPTEGCYQLSLDLIRGHTTRLGGEKHFVYGAITETNAKMYAAEKRFLFLRSNHKFYFRKEDAELIIRNEVAKRRNFYNIGKVKNDLGISTIALHDRIKRGSLDAVKCGSYWFVRKESADRVKETKRVDQDIPAERVPIAKIVRIIGLSRRYFDNKLITRDGKQFFIYETIGRGKVVEAEIRVYTDSHQRKYVSARDAKYIAGKERQIEKWPTISEFSGQIGKGKVTLHHNCDPAKGTATVFLDRVRYVEIEYIVLRNKIRLHPKESREAIDFMRFRRLVGERAVTMLPPRAQIKLRDHIGLKSIDGARELLIQHIDAEQGVMHLTEALLRTHGRFKYVEFYNLGIPCNVIDRSAVHGKRQYDNISITIERKDAELVEFYVGMMNGTEEAKRTLRGIIDKLKTRKKVTTNEVVMVFIARFIFMQSTGKNERFLDKILHEGKMVKKRKWAIPLHKRLFNPRTIGSIPPRYWVTTRKQEYLQ
ncbi:MAG: hypothetical protein PHF60_04005 [Candidatus ainarchaeum sp.]|nr:hypothetical protein [Candidatus ainarchaeum sp.]